MPEILVGFIGGATHTYCLKIASISWLLHFLRLNMLFQDCSKIAPRLFQDCSKIVPRLFQDCFLVHFPHKNRYFCCSKIVPRLLQNCSKIVPRLFQDCPPQNSCGTSKCHLVRPQNSVVRPKVTSFALTCVLFFCCTFAPDDFLSRFLLHLLPPVFHAFFTWCLRRFPRRFYWTP